ncbi:MULTISPECIES: hypothetical protein [Latilactobacillus]|uniref:Uncharacterized protein n=1 Tax=Latilactobacillus curvatus TaxID=28038 RepID=A0ABN6GL11_LATCU|nr:MULTISPECIES: hypothetical protein [Latilactobacillus]ASN13610.1 hypothetical protein B4V05_10285 [Latilactobacillus sakei]KGB13842.1 hypothetical protein KY41_10970 [Latilactobacillus sakei]MCW8780314.1 hypothetical protein [Latilactobacillus curvatus]UTB73269.1 hypothetical protein A4W72_10950 [Latilactobacillus curvatus]BCX31552.1 hypothetical protein LTWDN19_21190 [Latilactobacillus curvatus]
MNSTDKIKTIYVIQFPDDHYVSKDTLSYGEEVIEHICLTKDLSDSYSFTNLNSSLSRELLHVAQKVNVNARLEKISFQLKTKAGSSAIVEYATDLYLKNNVAVHIHLDDPTITLELTPNINEAYHYNPLDQRICRDHYSELFSNANFYSISQKSAVPLVG